MQSPTSPFQDVARHDQDRFAPLPRRQCIERLLLLDPLCGSEERGREDERRVHFLQRRELPSYVCLFLPSSSLSPIPLILDPLFHSDKNITYVRADGGVTQLTFIWLPQGSPTGMEAYFKRLTPSTIPSHIIVGWSLWFARMPANEYTKSIKTSLDKLLELAPDAKILARTSGAVVQAIVSWEFRFSVLEGERERETIADVLECALQQCYDRIGGQRWEMEKNNAALILRSFLPCLLPDSSSPPNPT